MRSRVFMVVLVFLVGVVAAAAPVDTATKVFAANKADGSLGYDYKEGVTYESSTSVTIDMKDAYESHSKKTDFDYLGQSIAAATIVDVTFEIEASAEGMTSGFYAAFTFNDGTPHSSKTALDGKGNGKTQGAFSEAVKAKFVEKSSGWGVDITHTNAGVESALASGYKTSGSANKPHEYRLLVNTDTLSVEIYEDGASVPFVTGSLPEFRRSDEMHAQWFVFRGYHTSSNNMALNDEAPSTEIREWSNGKPVVGKSGQTPTVVSPGVDVSVSVLVEDFWGIPSDGVELFYTVDGVKWPPVTMSGPGGKTGSYGAKIPAQPNGAHVTYQVRATDHGGNVGFNSATTYTVGSGAAAKEDTSITPAGGSSGGGSFDSEGRSYLMAFLFVIGTIAVALVLRSSGMQKYTRLVILAGLSIAAFLALNTALGGVFERIPPAGWLVVAGLSGGWVYLRFKGGRVLG